MNRFLIPVLCCSGLLPALLAMKDDVPGYPRPDLLIEAAKLARPEVAKSFVILDARAESKFQQGHLPGARWVNHEHWAKSFDHGQDAKTWSKIIGALGIRSDTRVIIYDDNYSKDAARIWWILRYWGVEQARLLNGGWVAWQSGKYPVETGDTSTTPTVFVARALPARLSTKEQLLGSLKQTDVLQIVDARSEKEFCGVEKLTNKRAGAIPGARQLEWIELLDQKTQRFKSAGQLKQLFDQAGIALDKPSATLCQSGGRASVMNFAMELMGSQNVSNYYPSWSEWGNADDTPIVPGQIKSKQ